MQIDTLARVFGSFLIVTAYYVVLHVNAVIGEKIIGNDSRAVAQIVETIC